MYLKNIFLAYKILGALSLILFISCSGNRPKDIDDPSLQKKWKMEEKNLLNQYFSKEVKKDSIILLSQPYTIQATDCLEEVIKDLPKGDFAQEDFTSRTAKDTLEWSASGLPSVKLLSVQKLPGGNETAKWNDLYRSIGGGYFQLSHVLFTKDLNSAIMHVEFSCGDRCGQEMTLLFQKSGKQWILKKRYCLKVS
nr:hypothetical protein [Pedobacter sp. ASV19]